MLFGRLKLPPHTVSFLHVAKDRMIIDIVLQRTAKQGQDGFLSHDMGPRGLLVPQLPVQDPAAVVVDGRDEIPLGLCQRGPQMVGGIMLEKFSHIVGQDLPVMGLASGPLLVIPIFLARSMIVGKDTCTLCFVSRISFT